MPGTPHYVIFSEPSNAMEILKNRNQRKSIDPYMMKRLSRLLYIHKVQVFRV